MIRFIKICFILFIIGIQPLWGQSNIFDCDNSRKFANYLFNTNQYELAQHELERISFFCNTDSSSQLLLLKSYRKLQHFDKANLFFLGKTQQDFAGLTPEFRLEYIRLLMAQKQYQQVQKNISQGLQFKQKKEHELGTTLLLKDWDQAYQLSIKDEAINSFKLNGLKKIANESYNTKRKKPWLATLMSAALPGSGKMYSGYWGDGVISFLFTTTTTFFAYRTFNKYGSDKIYPWIVSGLAVSYYAGNIYGGNRAAIHYNENLNHEFIHETEQILYSDY